MATVWTAASLFQDLAPTVRPSSGELRSMLDELHDEWVPEEFDVSQLHLWSCERFGTTLEELTNDILKDRVARRIAQMKRLYDLIRLNEEVRTDGDVVDKLARIAKIIRESRNSLTSLAILYFQMDTTRRFSIPDQWSPESFFQYIDEDEKANSFQKVLVHILRQMSMEKLRKIDDWTYKEVVIEETNERTHAWKPYMSIRDYIYGIVKKEIDYAEWKNLTNPHDNGERVVQHLMRSNEAELPTINVNRYIWAYRNGLYNVRDDMFWPFRSIMIRSFDALTPETVQMLPVYEPTPSEMARLPDTDYKTLDNGVVAYNLSEEDELSVESILYCEASNTYHSNFMGREVWTQLSKDIAAFRRGVHIMSLGDVSVEKAMRCPTATSDTRLDSERALLVNEVHVWNCGEHGSLLKTTIFQIVGHDDYRINDNGHPAWHPATGVDEKPYTAEVPTSEDVAVKYFDQPFRFEITPATEAVFDPSAIRLPELELIMESQLLTKDTQMWMVLMLCRLFFPVGFDRWQVALFIKGIAGSGKSTIAQIIRHFYPPQKVTTLASNIEAKFGLSAIYKGLVCICAEVREDFGLDQADWQSAVSGEEVQIAIKNKTAIPHKWDTPLLLLGNELPNYRNNSGSVDRRIFMIEFRKRVFNSDPKLFDKFLKNIDLFQRKGVALYHATLRECGDKDIWAANVVGEQLTLFRQSMKQATDMLLAFLKSDMFEFDTDTDNTYIPMNEFIERYKQYRHLNGADKVRWTKDHYLATFEEMGLCVLKDTRIWENNRMTSTWVAGLRIRQTIADDD